MPNQQTPPETRTAFVAITGKPNVGKSSLLNRLLGEKVAIVSPRPQTTRNRITGVLTQGETQIVFIDTPGLHKPKTRLGEFMVTQVNTSVADVDLALLVVEPEGEITKAEAALAESFSVQKRPAVAVINKIDTLPRKELLIPRMEALSHLYAFDEVIPISALTGEGVDTLLGCIIGKAKPGPHFFPDDALTDQPERVIAAEIIREKLLFHLFEEIPHGTAVEIESMKERKTGDIIDITATIFCEKAGHKGMIIGKNGQMLKTIATAARQDLERFLDTKVNLQCWVKVSDDWRNKDRALKNFGYQ